MSALGVVNGLRELGYGSEDVPMLVEGTLPQVGVVTTSWSVIILRPQERVTKLSPRRFTEEQLAKLFEDSMEVF